MPRSFGALLVSIALAAAACGDDTPGLGIEGFAPELMNVRGGGPWVEPQLQRAVADAHWLKAGAESGVPTLPLSIELGQLTGTAQTPVLRLVAEAFPPEALRARFGGELEVIIEVEASDGPIDPTKHGRQALGRAISVLDAQVGLALDGREAIPALLAAEDPQIVMLGLDYILDHRARAYADEVAGLVEHTDERVALRAVECIGVVGDARHARALVRLPRLADRAYAQRIYDALARLGGEDAQGFLEFAARNEDDPLMMEVAADALSRLKARGTTAGLDESLAPRGHR